MLAFTQIIIAYGARGGSIAQSSGNHKVLGDSDWDELRQVPCHCQ